MLRRVDWSGLSDVLVDRSGVIFMVKQSNSWTAATLTRLNTPKTPESSQTQMKARNAYNKVKVKLTLPVPVTLRSNA
jgi:hypothetical protein